MRLRLLYATLVGLVLAGIVHIAAVLAIPLFAETDAVSRASASESLDHPQSVYAVATGHDPAAPEAWLPIADPSVAVGVCGYDLADGPMRVSARSGPLALSLAAHARRGAFYAVTDQAAVRGALDLVILTRAQYDEALAADDENEPSRDVRIVAPESRGFVVVRVLAGLPSQRPAANAAIQAVSCTTDAAADDASTKDAPGKEATGKDAPNKASGR